MKEYMIKGFTMDDERSEVIYERADSNKPFMGLTTFKGDIPVLSKD